MESFDNFDSFRFPPHISLSQAQWRNLDDFLGWTKNFREASPFRDIRPLVPIKGNARAWWGFAYACVTQENRKKRMVWNWDAVKKRRILQRKYIALYKKKRRKTIRAEGLKELERLEMDEASLSVDDILLFRSIALEMLRREIEEEKRRREEEEEEERKKKKEGGWGGWVTSLWSGGKEEKGKIPSQDQKQSSQKKSADRSTKKEKMKNEDVDEGTEDEEGQIAKEVWRDLYSALDYQENQRDASSASGSSSSSSLFPREYVKTRAKFKIESLSLQILDSHWPSDHKALLPKLSPILEISLHEMNLHLDQRVDSMSVKASLRSLDVCDHISAPNFVVPLIQESHIHQSPSSKSKENNLLYFEFHDHPLDKIDVDYAVTLRSRPLDVTATRPILLRLKDFFIRDHLSQADRELIAYLNQLQSEKQKQTEMAKYQEHLSRIQQAGGSGSGAGGGGAILDVLNDVTKKAGLVKNDA